MAALVSAPQPSAIAHPLTQMTGKHLIFLLGLEEYAINVMSVREIMKMQQITVVPQTPDYVQGVINLRGKIVPVISLRRRFGIEDKAHTDLTCIVVVRMLSDEGERPVGLIVDGVVEVLTFNPGDVEGTPDFGLNDAVPYVHGMAKIKGRVKIVLDIDQVLHGTQLDATSGQN